MAAQPTLRWEVYMTFGVTVEAAGPTEAAVEAKRLAAAGDSRIRAEEVHVIRA